MSVCVFTSSESQNSKDKLALDEVFCASFPKQQGLWKVSEQGSDFIKVGLFEDQQGGGDAENRMHGDLLGE